MAIIGALQGLGNEGAAIEQARQQHEADVRQAIIDRLAQNQDTRAQQELDLRKRSEAQRERQAGAPVAVGNPYRAADGKAYQRYADPNTGQITAKAIDEPEEESPIQAITREIGQAEAAGIKLTPEQKQAIIEAKLGGKSLVSNRANRFGSFVQDPDSPTGFSRAILDGTTLEPTGRKDYGLPSGALPKERTGYKVMTTEDGSQYLVPITTTTRTPGAKPAGATGGGAKGGSTTPSPANVPKPTSTPANGTPEQPLPKGAIPFGKKPSPQDRQLAADAIKASQQARPMVNLLDATEAYIASGKFTPRGDLAVVVRAVRAMNPGSVRLPQKELDLELRAGSFGDRFKRWYTNALTGILPDDQRQDLMNVIREETGQVARDAAANWVQTFGSTHPLPPHLKRFAPGTEPAPAKPAAVPAKNAADPLGIR